MSRNIRAYLQHRLKADGFDGLFDGHGCACDIARLMHCERMPAHCAPGYYLGASTQSRDGAGDHARIGLLPDEAGRLEARGQMRLFEDDR